MPWSRALPAFLGLALLVGTAAAQPTADYPNHPVRIIVNVTPSGGVDFATRLVAQKLSERLGQTFVVENRAGAAGNAAAEAVYRSPPDGYTLLASFNSTVSISDYLFKGLNYEPLGFEPVAVLTYIPLALVVRPDLPVRDAREFIAYARANPGKLTFASNGVGTAGHLTAEFFMALTGTKMTHVPYKGTAPVLSDLIAGNVDLTFIQYSAFYELYKAGRVRILATASEKRLDTLPDIPTMGELGLPEIISKTWNVISAPPKTPPVVLAKLNKQIDEILHSPDVQARFAETHAIVEGGSLDYAKKYVAEDRARWGKVITAAGIKPE
ncbi:MAG TPA: tripartite tricarboxylate transporter substrate binding protein [Xanthobacteraceae bacterium]|nr:tripartite tricarboxylate transporter substrate binding protein [Xanthobacteraceae bacterium]